MHMALIYIATRNILAGHFASLFIAAKRKKGWRMNHETPNNFFEIGDVFLLQGRHMASISQLGQKTG